jgi:hypothetical protein
MAFREWPGFTLSKLPAASRSKMGGRKPKIRPIQRPAVTIRLDGRDNIEAIIWLRR